MRTQSVQCLILSGLVGLTLACAGKPVPVTNPSAGLRPKLSNSGLNDFIQEHRLALQDRRTHPYNIKLTMHIEGMLKEDIDGKVERLTEIYTDEGNGHTLIVSTIGARDLGRAYARGGYDMSSSAYVPGARCDKFEHRDYKHRFIDRREEWSAIQTCPVRPSDGKPETAVSRYIGADDESITLTFVISGESLTNKQQNEYCEMLLAIPYQGH